MDCFPEIAKTNSLSQRESQNYRVDDRCAVRGRGEGESQGFYKGESHRKQRGTWEQPQTGILSAGKNADLALNRTFFPGFRATKKLKGKVSTNRKVLRSGNRFISL